MSGEGSLFRRKSDGRWIAQISTGSPPKRTVIRRSARTRAEAKRLLDDLLVTSGHVDHRTTVGVYLRGWLDGPGRDVLKPSTWETYEIALRRQIQPAIGEIALASLKPEHVEALVGNLGRTMTPKGVRNVVGFLGRVLTAAERRRHIVSNPVRFVELPRLTRRLGPPAMTPADARRVLEAVRGDRLEALYVVTLACGLRQAEVLGLRWADVDLDAATLRVEATLDRVDRQYVLTDPKTKRSRRTLALPRFAVEALRAHRVRQLEERVAAGAPTEDGLVFVAPTGRPINGGWLSHRWRRLAGAAGLDLRFHDLRHGQASLLIAAGVHPRLVMERLGHAQVGIAMELYGHVGSQLDRDAVERFEAEIAADTGGTGR